MGKKPTLYESRYGNQSERKVICHRCNKTKVSVRVDPNHQGELRIICSDCKRRVHNNRKAGEREETMFMLGTLARNIAENHGAGPVKHFTPESKGFDERAKEFWENRRKERDKAYHYNTFGRGQ